MTSILIIFLGLKARFTNYGAFMVIVSTLGKVIYIDNGVINFKCSRYARTCIVMELYVLAPNHIINRNDVLIVIDNSELIK